MEIVKLVFWIFFNQKYYFEWLSLSCMRSFLPRTMVKSSIQDIPLSGIGKLCYIIVKLQIENLGNAWMSGLILMALFKL